MDVMALGDTYLFLKERIREPYRQEGREKTVRLLNLINSNFRFKG